MLRALMHLKTQNNMTECKSSIQVVGTKQLKVVCLSQWIDTNWVLWHSYWQCLKTKRPFIACYFESKMICNKQLRSKSEFRVLNYWIMSWMRKIAMHKKLVSIKFLQALLLFRFLKMIPCPINFKSMKTILPGLTFTTWNCRILRLLTTEAPTKSLSMPTAASNPLSFILIWKSLIMLLTSQTLSPTKIGQSLLQFTKNIKYLETHSAISMETRWAFLQLWSLQIELSLTKTQSGELPKVQWKEKMKSAFKQLINMKIALNHVLSST